MKIIQEFKEFAIKGNAIDLAVGVVIGAAFGKVVGSIVDDLINPFISLLTGGIDFSHQVWVLKAATETSTAVTLNYGVFVNTLINFTIIAFAIFMVVKQINRLKKEKPADNSAPVVPEDIKLLTEIRDSLSR